MKQDERDYLLKIINIQDGMLQAYAQKNMSKFVMLNKELDSMRKASFSEAMGSIKEQKKKLVTEVDDLLTKIQSTVKELKNL